jgi:uncharacterized protein YciI
MIGWDGPDGATRRDQHRERHLAHIHELEREGRITFAGPIRNDTNDRSIGAVIVLEAAALKEARSTVDCDPFVSGGVFETITVSPFKQVIPEPQ